MEKNLEKETFDEFCRRIEETLYNFPKDIFHRTIKSMRKRVQCVIEAKGQRTKY